MVGAGLSGQTALTPGGRAQCNRSGRPGPAGGRIYTMDQIPGHPEAGGNIMAGSMAGLSIVLSNWEWPCVLLRPPGIGLGVGQQQLATEWATSSANQLPDDWRALPPSRLLGRLNRQPLLATRNWLAPALVDTDKSAAQALLHRLPQ